MALKNSTTLFYALLDAMRQEGIPVKDSLEAVNLIHDGLVWLQPCGEDDEAAAREAEWLAAGFSRISDEITKHRAEGDAIIAQIRRDFGCES